MKPEDIRFIHETENDWGFILDKKLNLRIKIIGYNDPDFEQTCRMINKDPYQDRIDELLNLLNYEPEDIEKKKGSFYHPSECDTCQYWEYEDGKHGYMSGYCPIFNKLTHKQYGDKCTAWEKIHIGRNQSALNLSDKKARLGLNVQNERDIL